MIVCSAHGDLGTSRTTAACHPLGFVTVNKIICTMSASTTTSTIMEGQPKPLTKPPISRARSRLNVNQLTSQPRIRSLSRQDVDRPSTEETEQQRIERLGRERPAQFKSAWAEIAFVYSIVCSQLIGEYFVSGFNVLLPTLMNKLDIEPSAAVWPSAAFALTTSAFLLPFGRVADMLGGYVVYMFGLVWFTVWSIIAGFSQNSLMLIFCRAFQGIGPAAFLPSGIMLMGSVYRPGPRKVRCSAGNDERRGG